MGGQRHASAAFTPGKETRYPLNRRLGGPQGRSGRIRIISPILGFDPRTVQPVASRILTLKSYVTNVSHVRRLTSEGLRRVQSAGSNKLIPTLDQADSPHGALTDKQRTTTWKMDLKYTANVLSFCHVIGTVKFYVTCDLTH